MADIFLGYARDDRDTAERIASAIEAKGWSVWWDVDLLGGQDFDEVIERQLHPVVYVSWRDAEAYCTWLTKKVGEGVVSLPTEAQWEFASRGAEGRTYPWGWEEPDEDWANFGDPDGETTSVDAYPGGATPTGIYDLAGNTWEWCRDSYGPYSGDPITDPTGPNESGPRVLRGGSFGYTRGLLRATYRRGVYQDVGYPNFGFRVVWAGLRVRP